MAALAGDMGMKSAHPVNIYRDNTVKIAMKSMEKPDMPLSGRGPEMADGPKEKKGGTPPPFPPWLLSWLRSLPAAPDAVWLVGGAVRDLASGRLPVDYDLVVSGDPAGVGARIARQTGGHLVRIGETHPLWRLLFPGEGGHAAGIRRLDLTRLQGDTVREDLVLRDFTVNAMACELSGEKGSRRCHFYDPCGGMADLDAGLIRMTNAGIFLADPVRLVRAFRFAARFGWRIEPATMERIRANAHRIQDAPGERLYAELIQILSAPGWHGALTGMAHTGVLEAMLPEISAMRGCGQNRHHAFDVREHTWRALEGLRAMGCGAEYAVASSGVWKQAAAEIIAGRPLSGEDFAVLIWALLLHDAGKPFVRTVDEFGVRRFIGHEKRGSEMAEEICVRLRFPGRLIKRITSLIRLHLHPFHLFMAHRKNSLRPRGKGRLFRRAGSDLPLLLLHSMADALGKGPPPDPDFPAFCARLAGEYRRAGEVKAQSPPLITGRDLMRELGIAPSPLLGRILSAIAEERLGRPEMTRAEALALAERLAGRAPEGG